MEGCLGWTGGNSVETASNSGEKPGASHPGTLIAISGADGNPLAALGATARQHGLSGFGLHAAAETMNFGSAAAIGLKCALRHGSALLKRFWPDIAVANRIGTAIYEYT